MIRYDTIEDLEPIFRNERYVTSYKLKQLIIKLKLKEHKCEKCLITEWDGCPAPLELHHKNGVHTDNSFDNLQILCPNCHSLEPTFCRKKNIIVPTREQLVEWVESGKTLYEICHLCGVRATGPSHYTVKRLLAKYGLEAKKSIKIAKPKAHKSAVRKYNSMQEQVVHEAKKQAKAKWPEDHILAEMVWQKSTSSIGRDLGVTQNAVKHRCHKRNIAVPPPGYWAKILHGYTQDAERMKEQAFKNLATSGRQSKYLPQQPNPYLIPCPGVEPGNPIKDTTF